MSSYSNLLCICIRVVYSTVISINFHHFLQYDCTGRVFVYNKMLHPCGYWTSSTGPCGSLSIRDVLPLELFTCLWLVSPQAPAVERLFSLPSAMVQQFDFIKHFLISTPFSNWCSLCCARSNFCLVQDTKIVTQRPNSRTHFLQFLVNLAPCKKSNSLLVSENSQTGAPYYHIWQAHIIT